MRAALLATLVLSGCLDDTRPSDGSRLEGPITWTGEMTVSSADALSVTLMANGPGVLSLEVRAADRVLVDAAAPERSPNRVLRGRDVVVGMIPSASASLPIPASVTASAARLAGDGPLTTSAWIKRGAPPAVQTLPLSVVLGADVPRAALSAALLEVRRIWRPAGIEIEDPALIQTEPLGDVVVDPALGSDSPAVGRVLRLSSNGPPGALALVVVSDVSVAGQGIWALAGGIPVPPVNGTARSGVVVSAVLVTRDPAFAGQVIAHEIGHALGLYHTTEGPLDGGGALHDQLDDTPACPADADRDPADGVLSATECATHDVGNLMFWSAVRGGARLTPGQADIARRSALAR
jgi:hypothetical protein